MDQKINTYHNSKIKNKIDRETLIYYKLKDPNISSQEKQKLEQLLNPIKIITICELYKNNTKNEIQNIIDVITFINSKLWNQLKQSSLGHDVGYDIIIKIMNSNQVLFYNNGKVTNDQSNMYNRMNTLQKDTLSMIDSTQNKNMFLVNGMFMMYIGSTIVIDVNGQTHYDFLDNGYLGTYYKN
jgi:hypothetical protein